MAEAGFPSISCIFEIPGGNVPVYDVERETTKPSDFGAVGLSSDIRLFQHPFSRLTIFIPFSISKLSSRTSSSEKVRTKLVNIANTSPTIIRDSRSSIPVCAVDEDVQLLQQTTNIVYFSHHNQ